jgi:predicted O-methyltransferase YrrM
MAKISHVGGAFRGSPHAFIATPTYSGKVDNSYLYSLLYSIERMQKAGIGFDHYLLSYNCHVDDARNGVLRDFMQTDCDQLIFIDADVAWEPEALIKLIQHDRDIVAGVYPKRTNLDQDFPVRVDPGVTLQADEQGLVEVAGAPTGFMKIKRHVIEKMIEANKHRQFTGVGAAPDSPPYTIVFERTYVDGHRWSGDYNFCRQWRAMGGKIFVDPEMYLTHTGEVEFSGTLGDFWKKKHGVEKAETEAKFEQAIADLKSGQVTSKTFYDLSHGWGNPYAANTELLASCYYLAKETSGQVLETGSGLSTLVMALANPNIHIHALEHEAIWGSVLKSHLEKYDIKNVTVHFGDLKSFDDGKWYDTTTLPKENFALALCDGPPRKISNRSLLWKNLGAQLEKAVVLMDDADNDEATKPMRDWALSLGREVKVLGKQRHFAVSPVGAN